MKAIKAYKYRIYPTEAQKTRFENQFSMCRHLYNWFLLERKETYEQEEKTVTYYEQQDKLPDLKKERPWFKDVHSQALQDVLKRLDKAFQAFFRRVKEGGEKPGYPKLKKKGQWNSITFPQNIEVPKNGLLQLPKKFTDIKIQYHREIPENAKVKTVTIIKEGGKWYASFSVEIEIFPELKQDTSKITGLDLGLIYFFKNAENEEVYAPRLLRKSLLGLKRLQKRLSKAKKRTKKYYKILRSLQKLHVKVKNQRKDFLHKTANELLKKFDYIVLEKLNIRNMIRRPKPKQDEEGKYLPNRASQKAGLNMSISDVGWGTFVLMLKYKAKELGKTVIEVDPRYTSQICSECGEKVKKSLSTRTHACPNCEVVLDRDHNAAINIMRLGMQSLGVNP